jgi:hypothetical protein
MTLSSRWRKLLVTLHVATAVGWLGVSAVMLTLGVAGLRGADPAVVYPAVGLVGSNLLVPISVVALALGVLTSLLTPWGLLRRWWVVTKLAITTVLTGLVLFVLWPTLRIAANQGAQLPPDARLQVVVAPAVSCAALVGATLLSTYKPWGRVRRRPSYDVGRSEPAAGTSPTGIETSLHNGRVDPSAGSE